MAWSKSSEYTHRADKPRRAASLLIVASTYDKKMIQDTDLTLEKGVGTRSNNKMMKKTVTDATVLPCCYLYHQTFNKEDNQARISHPSSQMEFFGVELTKDYSSLPGYAWGHRHGQVQQRLMVAVLHGIRGYGPVCKSPLLQAMGQDSTWASVPTSGNRL